MRFYFDFTDGPYATRDQDGHECASVEAARTQALRALSEVLFNEHQDVDFREIMCEVRSELGEIVCWASATIRAAAVGAASRDS